MGLLRSVLMTMAALFPVAASADDRPAYSLVAAGSVSTTPSYESACGDDAICDRISWGAFLGSRTLAGPDLGEHFGAAIVVHLPVRNEPMLVVVEPLGGGEFRVAARGRWNPETGLACVDRRELDRIGFHPMGDGIIESDFGPCAKIERLGGLASIATPVMAITAEQIAELGKPAAAPPFMLAKHGKGSGPVVLAEIRTRRGYPNGEWWCPPDTDWETDICLGASIIIAPGKLIRRLGATPDADAIYERGKFKFIGGHAVRYVDGGHYVAAIEQTDEDYWYIQWQVPVEKGRFCISPDAIVHYGMTSELPATIDEDGGRCFSLRDAKKR